MARTKTYICDVCRKPTEKIAGKIFFTPLIPGVSKGIHSNYSHHADVGVCCKDRILKLLNFSPRMSAQEYADARKNGKK